MFEKTLVDFYANSKYENAYNRVLIKMQDFYDEGHNFEDFQNIFVEKYKKNNMDPDGMATRFIYEIKCTADGLHSINRICSFEKNVNDIIDTYRNYRKYPIFFFPCEICGINTSRASIFGDRIDHTLYDLKMFYTNNKGNCKLKSAFARPKTNLWINKMGSFENIVNWLGIKGIFTDDNYDIYDLEYSYHCIIKEYKDFYSKQWTEEYYENLKKKILQFYEKTKCHICKQ